MNLYILFFSIFVYIWTISCQSFRPVAFLEAYLGMYRGLRKGLSKSIGRNSEDQLHLQKARDMGIIQKQFPTSFRFPCNVTGFRSLKSPSNVNQVRPGDIDIVAALGDSLTAGNGLIAINIFQLLQENRGLSWSIGGQGTWREYTTLPNILKEFNPNLFGFSTRDSLTTDRESQFNPSELGAISSELPYMAQVLVKRIKSDSRVRLNQHWKLITIMIGANDLCSDICMHDDLKSVLERHRNDLITVLRILKDNLPKTIINITSPPNVKLLRKLKGRNSCQLFHYIECLCLFADRLQDKLETFYNIIDQWVKIDEEVASIDEFQKNDFSVIYQPFIMGLEMDLLSENEIDFTKLSSDCFHLSQKMHARAATSLWNNMMEKVGNKSKIMFPLMNLICPTIEQPYIFTAYNSHWL